MDLPVTSMQQLVVSAPPPFISKVPAESTPAGWSATELVVWLVCHSRSRRKTPQRRTTIGFSDTSSSPCETWRGPPNAPFEGAPIAYRCHWCCTMWATFVVVALRAAIQGVQAQGECITTIAGTGAAGYNRDGIAATSSQLYNPLGLAVCW
jgi:hypothetical protein